MLTSYKIQIYYVYTLKYIFFLFNLAWLLCMINVLSLNSTQYPVSCIQYTIQGKLSKCRLQLKQLGLSFTKFCFPFYKLKS